jgi:hypothetical protein
MDSAMNPFKSERRNDYRNHEIDSLFFFIAYVSKLKLLTDSTFHDGMLQSQRRPGQYGCSVEAWYVL